MMTASRRMDTDWGRTRKAFRIDTVTGLGLRGHRFVGEIGGEEVRSLWDGVGRGYGGRRTVFAGKSSRLRPPSPILKIPDA